MICMVTKADGEKKLLWLPDELANSEQAISICESGEDAEALSNHIASVVREQAASDEVWDLLFPEKKKGGEQDDRPEPDVDGSVHDGGDRSSSDHLRDVHA